MSNGFAALGIREELVESLKASGVVEPTPIQREAIPALLSKTDVIAQAQTGTGKTLAFVLPMLELIDVKKDHVQGLILTPTRELAIQISEELSKLAPLVGAKVLAAYGGQDVERQLRKLQKSIHIVVGTPGRLLDHLRRGSVEFYKLDMLVLDEADQMLHMGFLKEVEEIIVQTSSRRQTLLFSATMPQQVRDLAKRFMKESKEIQIQAKQVTLTEIDQVLVEVTDRGKQDALLSAIATYKPYLAMIFCRTKRRAKELNEALQEQGYASDELHGDLSQAKREQVMKRFRDAKIEFLIATDVAARGLDVEGVTHVFNYDIPHDAESYIHRIGRTGRAGQKGVAITFATPRDMVYLELIEKGIRMSLRPQKGAPRRNRAEASDYLITEESSSRHKGNSSSRRGEGSGRNESGGRRGRSDNRGSGKTGRNAGNGRSAGSERGAKTDSNRSRVGSEFGRSPRAGGEFGHTESTGNSPKGALDNRGRSFNPYNERSGSADSERGRGGRTGGSDRVRGQAAGAERGRAPRAGGAERERGFGSNAGAERGRAPRAGGAERERGFGSNAGAERGRGPRAGGAERERGFGSNAGAERGRGPRAGGAERERGFGSNAGAERGRGPRAGGAERERGFGSNAGAESGRGPRAGGAERERSGPPNPYTNAGRGRDGRSGGADRGASNGSRGGNRNGNRGKR